nr:putative FMN adenylyltransferase [Ensifer sp.]
MLIIGAESRGVFPGSVVSVGSFDGVHLGHRQLLHNLRRIGERTGLPTTVVTFDPLPRSVVHPDRELPLLCSLATRLRLIDETGDVDQCCVLSFDERMMRCPVEEFVLDQLVNRFSMRILVVGENFACGRNRQGDNAFLTALGKRYAFSVAPQPLYAPPGGIRCSSTEARRLVEKGELAEVERLLGRAHQISGVVIERKKMGARTILLVAIDCNLHAPPPADYFGAISAGNGGAPWRQTLITVSAPLVSGRQHRAHLVVDEQVELDLGTAIDIRFLRCIPAVA